MRLRHTSIRVRMILLVLVPLLALIGIYAYAVVGQVSTAVGLANAGKISGTTITPVSNAMVALNAERSGAIGRTAAINDYSAVMADGVRVAEQSLQETFVSQSLATTARQEVSLYEAEMLALEENDIYSGDVAAGQLPAADQKEFVQLAGVRRYLVQDAVPQLDAEAAGLLQQEVPASLSGALTSQEDAIIGAPAGSARPPVPLGLWQRTVQTYATNLEVMLTKSPAWIQSQVTSSARGALTTLFLAAGLGLLAVIASIVFSLLLGRRLLRRLDGLRRSALELAHDRLPSVMERLRDGETVDVDVEAPPVEAGWDEIDQVRAAFDTVHRAAVAAAVDEASLRRGVSEVFRNLARRSQALLHRQLGLLDGMERRAEEPEQLEDLFRIDHLTTRMRRHAEGLIVLSGDSAGRGWREPVSFIDVLRAAAAEVEDYTRVRVEVRSKTALAGPAVADVVHLLAELMENATVFSPPNTVVRVQGEPVGRGFAIEIEDRGLGITEERLAEINRDLASLPAFDLASSDRLGLFVAGRLAYRHGIKITLRSSVYGGTTAVVIIPKSLVVTDDSQVPALATEERTLLQPATAGTTLSSGNGHAGNGHRPESWVPARRAADAAANPRSPRHAVGSTLAAESIPVGQAAGSATEPVPGLGADPAATAPTPPAYEQDGGLPVRVRRASLAPQLRDRKPADGEAVQAAPASAEAVKTTMSAMQRGWELGRSAAAGPPDAAGPDAASAERNVADQDGQ